MKYLLPLLLLMLACEKEATVPSTPRQCTVEPEDLRRCRDLTALSADDHRAALLGSWRLVATECGFCATAMRRDCGCVQRPAGCTTVTYRPDGTLLLMVPGDTVRTADYRIETVGERTWLRHDGDFYLPLITQICRDFAYADARPVDGTLELYQPIAD